MKPSLLSMKLIALSFFCLSNLANAMTLTFDANYNSKITTSGLDQTSSEISPINFQFQVEFDPTQITNSQYTYNTALDNGDGTTANYSFQANNTSFGKPLFTETPVSKNLGIDSVMNATASNGNIPSFQDYSSSSLNQGYNYYDSNYSSSGYKEMGFGNHYEYSEFTGSGQYTNYKVYYIETGLNLPDAPNSLGEVTFANSSELISYLTVAREQGYYWNLNEFGRSYPDGGGISETSAGEQYFGLARLIAIDGVAAPVPEPETYAMMLLGIGVLGFMARRKKNSAA